MSCNVLVGNAAAYLKSELLGRRGVVFLAHLGKEGFFFWFLDVSVCFKEVLARSDLD